MTAIPWIIDLPPNDVDITGYHRQSFMNAARGHEKMGELLAQFVKLASWKAKDQEIDITAEECLFIDIFCKPENIAKNAKISRKSLSNYLKEFETLGYVEAPMYQRFYRVYFKKINAAIQSPPTVAQPKPRGKYAPPVKKPTPEEKAAQKRLVLQTKLVNLQQKLVSLQNKMVSLQKELITLPTSQTAESILQAGLEGIFDPLRTLQNFTELLRDDSHVASADTESDGAATFLSQLRSFDATLKEVQQNGKAPLSVSPHKREGRSQEEPLVKSADTSLSSGATHTSTPNDITSQEEALQGKIPTQVALIPALPVTPTKTPPTNKTVGKGKSKIPDPVPLCSSRTIREAIDAIRGYSLDETGAIIHQNKVLKEWCQKHTLEEYQHVIDHVTKGHCANKEHQFWREGTNFASFFNADKLAKLTPGILSELGHIPKPVAPPEVAPKEEKIIGWQPQRRITPPTGVTVTYA